MGNDGGSIPTRRELVREAAKQPSLMEIKQATAEAQEHGWTTDPLTHEPLRGIIVADGLGRLYNMESLVDQLLAMRAASATADRRVEERARLLEGRVSSIKDVVDVKFQRVEGERAANGADCWVCPVSMKPMGAAAKAAFLVPCGHAFAGSAIKELGAEDGGVCVMCNSPYAPNDVIPILPTDPLDIARLELRLKNLRERGLTHSLQPAKKQKKSKKEKSKKDKGDSEVKQEDGSDDVGTETKKRKLESDDGVAKAGRREEGAESKKPKQSSREPSPTAPHLSTTDGIKNSYTAMLTSKVLADQEQKNKQRASQMNDNLKSLFHKSDDAPSLSKSSDFMTRGYSIPRNQGKR